MQIRDATADDFEALRAVAAASLHDSYHHMLDPKTIDEALEEWYAADLLAQQLADDDAVLLVAEDDAGIVAFSQSEIMGKTPADGRILWLHVHPDHRGHGYGSRLLTRTKEALVDHGAQQISGAVLDGNRHGNEFYRAHGFKRAGDRTVTVADETLTENVFVATDEEHVEWESLDEVTLGDETAYVNYAEAHRGTEGQFYEAYVDAERERRYGLFCGACNSFDNAMGPMEEVVCNSCGNRRKATRWDAAYL